MPKYDNSTYLNKPKGANQDDNIVHNDTCDTNNYICKYINHFFYLLNAIFIQLKLKDIIDKRIYRNYILKLDYVMNIIFIIFMNDIDKNNNILSYTYCNNDNNFNPCINLKILEETNKKIEYIKKTYIDQDNMNISNLISLQDDVHDLQKINNHFSTEYQLISVFMKFKNNIKINDKDFKIFINDNNTNNNINIFQKIIYIYNVITIKYNIDNEIYYDTNTTKINISTLINKIKNGYYNNNISLVFNNELLKEVINKYKKNLNLLYFFKNNKSFISHNEQYEDNTSDYTIFDEIINKFQTMIRIDYIKDNVTKIVKKISSKFVQFFTNNGIKSIIIGFKEEPCRTAAELKEYLEKSIKDKLNNFIILNIADFIDLIYQNTLSDYIEKISDNIEEKHYADKFKETLKKTIELYDNTKDFVIEFSIEVTKSINNIRQDVKNILYKNNQGGSIDNNNLYYMKYMKYKLKYNKLLFLK